MLYSSKMISEKKEISSLEGSIITPFYKGLPITATGKSISDFLSSEPNLFTSDFQFPVAVLKRSSLEHNIRRMAQYCEEMGVAISPHVKTTMSPQIAQMQVDHGAWAITVANFFQASVFLGFGFKRIFIANEVLDKSAIREISQLNLKEGIEIYFYIESSSGLEIIQSAIADLPEARLYLFIEMGAEGARAGIRDVNDVEALVKKVVDDKRLVIKGVAGFEGVIPVEDRSLQGSARMREFCQKIVAAGKIINSYMGENEIILTAGGSAYFDVVVEEFRKYGPGCQILIRSGGYVSHDHGGYERTYPFADEELAKRFLPAIELWAQVLSQPDSKLAILNMGKRDVGNDVGEPLPLKRIPAGKTSMESIRGVVDHLNDQHGYLVFEEEQEISVGDLIGLGISHPCTTFDKWRLIPVVDDEYRVVDLFHTFF